MLSALVHQVLSAPERQGTKPLNPILSHQRRRSINLPCIRQPNMSTLKFVWNFLFAIRVKPNSRSVNSRMNILRSDNGNDHRAGTEIMQAEKQTRKTGFACIVLLSRVFLHVHSRVLNTFQYPPSENGSQVDSLNSGQPEPTEDGKNQH
jgi:hypothetical protein